MSYTFDAISLKKTHIQVSDGDSSEISTFHTAHPNFTWTPGDTSGEQWIEVNLYQSEDIQDIELRWSGTFSTIRVEFSVNGVEWMVLTPTRSLTTEEQQSKFLDIDYFASSLIQKAPYIRVIIGDPGNLVINTFELHIIKEFDFNHFISHNIFNLYGDAERELYPILPDFTKTILEMFELKEDIGVHLRLFLESDFASFGLISTVDGLELTIRAEGLPSGVKQYIWDFGDYNDTSVSGEDCTCTIGENIMTTNLDLSSFSVDELAGKALTIYEPTTAGGIEVVNTFDYIVSNNTNDTTSNTITITTTFSKTHDNDSFNIREYDDSTEQSVSNYVVTNNPLNSFAHTYSSSGTYFPRIIMKFDSFTLNFKKKIII